MDDLDNPQKILDAKKAASGPWGETASKFPLLFAKAVFFGHRPSKDLPAEISNGTLTLADLGSGPMGITCRHVVAQYRERRERESNLLFQIGSVELDPLAQLIDEDEALDIATIGLTNEQVEKITDEGEIGSCVFKPKSWPPIALKKSEFVAFGGFPGALRTVASFDEIIFNSWSSGASEVASVSDSRIVLAFDRKNWVSSFGDKNHMSLKALGGLSGGPVFMHRGLSWELVGIISDYHENYDTVLAASVQRLRVNGTIEPSPI